MTSKERPLFKRADASHLLVLHGLVFIPCSEAKYFPKIFHTYSDERTNIWRSLKNMFASKLWFCL